MTKKDETTTPTQPTEFRLFADSEETYRLRRPSVHAFNNIREVALMSIEIPLAAKFLICEELCLYWKDALKINGMKRLKEILANMDKPNPIYLGQKVLDANGITEEHSTSSLSSIEAQAAITQIIFETKQGESIELWPEKTEELIIGTVRQGAALFMNQINISDDEELSDRVSFRAFVNSEDTYPLAPVSVKNLRKISELQLQTPSIPERDRKDIAREMKLDYDKLTPAKIQDGVSKADYWTKAAEIVLGGVTIDEGNGGLVDAGEINRALAVFFQRSEGLM